MSKYFANQLAILEGPKGPKREQYLAIGYDNKGDICKVIAPIYMEFTRPSVPKEFDGSITLDATIISKRWFNILRKLIAKKNIPRE